MLMKIIFLLIIISIINHFSLENKPKSQTVQPKNGKNDICAEHSTSVNTVDEKCFDMLRLMNLKVNSNQLEIKSNHSKTSGQESYVRSRMIHALTANHANSEKVFYKTALSMMSSRHIAYMHGRSDKNHLHEVTQLLTKNNVRAKSFINISNIRQHLTLKRPKRYTGTSMIESQETILQNESNAGSFNIKDEWEKYIFNTFGRKVSKQKLLTMFSLICPVKETCHMNLSGSQFQYSGKSSFSQCTQCLCDSSCIYKDVCCPGSIFGYMPYECTSTVLYSNDVTAYNIVTKCPPVLQNTSLSNKCSGPESKVNPVSSNISGVTYKNTYCALCHNDTVHTTWGISVQCDRNTSFSYHKSIAEVKESLKEDKCLIRYRSNTTSKICFFGRQTIKACNITGLWRKFDKDVNWACENLKLQYQHFQNVFCYICNPSITSARNTYSIAICNVTGMWSMYDPSIEYGCKHYGQIERISPFKNIYCALCNGIEDTNIKTSNLRVLVYKNSTSRSVVSQTQLTFRYEFIYPGSSPEEFLNEFVPQLKNVIAQFLINKTEVSMPQKYDNDINRTVDNDMIRQAVVSYAAVCGKAIICNKSLINESYTSLKTRNPICGSCSCNTHCLTDINGCCVDILLQKNPYSCYEYNTTQSDNKTMDSDVLQYLVKNDIQGAIVVDKCISNNYQWIKSYCEESIKNDTIYNAPILSQNTNFKNIYCFICNGVRGMFYFDVRYYCDGYVEPWLFSNATDVLSYAKRYCSRSFKPEASACKYRYTTSPFGILYERVFPELTPASKQIRYLLSDPPNITVYDSCNISKTWLTDIPIIKKVCEAESTTVLELPEYRDGLNIYKNVACFVCNPKNGGPNLISESVKSTCDNESSWYDEKVDILCKEEAYSPLWFPYKNFHCENCNLPPLQKVSVLKRTGVGLSDISYRVIFSLAPDDWQKIASEYHDEDNDKGNFPFCADDIQGNCENIHCRQGLTLSNMSCIPLLETAFNVTYEVRLTMIHAEPHDCNASTRNFSGKHICNVFVSAIKMDLINIGDYIVSSCILIHSTDCKDYFNSITDKCQYSFISQVTLLKTSTLSLFESRLMSFLSKVFNLHGAFAQFCQFSFLLDFSYYMNKKSTSLTRNNKNSFVDLNRCFNCPYIKLNTSEFHADKHTIFQEEIVVHGVSVPVKYIGWSNLNACLCMKDYNTLSQEKQGKRVSLKKSRFVKIYNIYSNICTIISLVCLFATFLTYCFFSDLRTVPGKNNMCLVFTLFVAQSSVGFLHLETPTRLYCVFIGVVLHYFWLATFFAMNVCSLHMFRLFSVKWFYLENSVSRTHLKYLVYTFVAPLVITSCTVLINLMRSNFIDIGYGNQRHSVCFLSDFYSIMFAFTVPSFCVFTVNIVFYISALYSIKTIRDRVRSAQDRHDLITYIKLCTVVGATMPLLLVDATMAVSWFSFIAVSVNALQGVFIFISYILNARVLNMYKSVLCYRERSAFAERYAAQETLNYTASNTTMSQTHDPKRRDESETTTH